MVIHTLFNRIAPRYDLLNRILSLGLDQTWRKKMLQHLPAKNDLTLLDVATGTADLPILFAKQKEKFTHITGVDIATDMLQVGGRKVTQAHLAEKIQLLMGDAQNLRFEDASFDVVTVAFGIRNMPDRKKALAEMTRVLKPGGTLIILEFSMPSNWLIKVFYLTYFRYVLPLIGGLISGDYQAYRYLNQSVEHFDPSFLRDLKAYPLCFKMATLYVAHKLAA